MEKMFYSVSEVSEELGEPQSKVRYWSDSFAFLVKPDRNAKGNRLYRQEDLQALREIKYLLTVERLTIEGAVRRLKEDNAKTSKNEKIIRELKEIKNELLDIKRYL